MHPLLTIALTVKPLEMGHSLKKGSGNNVSEGGTNQSQGQVCSVSLLQHHLSEDFHEDTVRQLWNICHPRENIYLVKHKLHFCQQNTIIMAFGAYINK